MIQYLHIRKRRNIMKRLLTLILMLVMIISLASCSMLPEDIQATINGTIEDIKNSVLGGDHEHEFVLVDSKAASCTREGYDKYECSCGESKEEPIEALGHDMQFFAQVDAGCAQYGTITYKCSRCVKKENETLMPIGHIWGEVVEASRLVKCTRDGCVGVKMADGNGKYTEALTFKFGDDEKSALSAKHDQLESILKGSDAYDSTLHGYVEGSDLEAEYETVYAVYEEYSDLIFAAQGQYSIAMTLYYCNHKDKGLEAQYNGMQTYYTDLVAKFYSLSQLWHDSKYRDYFFYGATEEEIKEFLFDSNAYSNPEYTALKDRNDAIELEFLDIVNPEASAQVPVLYAEFVQNNIKIAEMLGYDNYLEYAYENVYDRDYTYEDVAQFVEYVKTYIAPLYNMVYTKWGAVSGYTDADIEQYYDIVKYSFFEKGEPNTIFNDYIDDMGMAFTSNPDKQISFSDHLNNLMSDGNLFRGSYEGAYVTYLVTAHIPVAYFGKGYDSTTTIAHEFGHYMNEVYNESEYDQSFDLLETHSQGNEMLFIYYVDGKISDKAYELVSLYQLLSTLQTLMLSVQVDCFEQAIYLNSYDGSGADVIMADCKITADEYDLLFESIADDLGVMEDFQVNEYWRYGMTISSPCYYISYAISGINALQIYSKIFLEGFDAAKDSYLKLITYTDVDPDMTVEEVLAYAGLLSYNDEEVYKNINKLLAYI